MRNSYFVTGTDTNVGKTVISAWLTYHLEAFYFKPIQSGSLETIDSQTVGFLAQTDRIIPEIYTFSQSLSPHLASYYESIVLDVAALNLPKSSTLQGRPLIVEGAGGVMVPLINDYLMIDLIKKFDLPVIIVARTSLGTINHSLLTIDALRKKNITIAGMILNGPINKPVAQTIERLGVVPILEVFEPFPLLNYHAIQARLPHSPLFQSRANFLSRLPQ